MENKKKKNEIALQQFLIYVLSEKKVHITDILTQIRAIKGVVTISIFESSKSVTNDKNFTKLKLKFLQYSQNTDENIKDLKKDILLIPGIYNIILKIKKTDLEKGSNVQPTAVRGTGGSSSLNIDKSNNKEETKDGINT